MLHLLLHSVLRRAACCFDLCVETTLTGDKSFFSELNATLLSGFQWATMMLENVFMF